MQEVPLQHRLVGFHLPVRSVCFGNLPNWTGDGICILQGPGNGTFHRPRDIKMISLTHSLDSVAECPYSLDHCVGGHATRNSLWEASC